MDDGTSSSGPFIKTGGKRTPVSCSYCQRDITTQCRIHCAVCIKNVDLCSDCFASGVCFEDHEGSHAYQVVDCIEFPIFAQDWTAQEELLLLEGFSYFSFYYGFLISTVQELKSVGLATGK
jgi:hypothetical protein